MTDDECPICGQPYDYRRTEKTDCTPELRDDATACKSAPLGGQCTVYVHIGSDGNVFESEDGPQRRRDRGHVPPRMREDNE